MYKLIYLEAKNVIGFKSGLGKTHVKFNLRPLINKDVIVILGGNATGKSTFMSLIHPWPTPTDGRNHFILPDKEGYVIRRYVDGDTILETRCVYKPKKDGRHLTSCFFAIKQDKDSDLIELNPNGNVTSYQTLLENYLGITKDFLTFASSTNTARSIIEMTDMERKRAIGTMTPNIKRFSAAYELLHRKYLDKSAIIRDISGKINRLGTIEQLEAIVKQLHNALQELIDARNVRSKRIAMIDGEINSLVGNTTPADVSSIQYQLAQTLEINSSELNRVNRSIEKLLGNDSCDSASDKLLDHRIALESAKQNREQLKARLSELTGTLSTDEKEELELLSSIQRLGDGNINDLKAALSNLKKQRDDLDYDKYEPRFRSLNMETANLLEGVLITLSDSARGILDKYGALLLKSNEGEISAELIRQRLASYDEVVAQREKLWNKLLSLSKYSGLGDILEKRPADCVDDSCPFIAQALQWPEIKREIELSASRLAEIDDRLRMLAEDRETLNELQSMYHDMDYICQIIKTHGSQLTLYYRFDGEKFIEGIAHGNYERYLRLDEVANTKFLLAKKEKWLKLTNELIPAAERSLELAELHGTNVDMLRHQLAKVRMRIADIRGVINAADNDLAKINSRIRDEESAVMRWSQVTELLEKRAVLNSSITRDTEAFNHNRCVLDRIDGLRRERDELSKEVHRLDKKIEEQAPILDRKRYDLDMVFDLKIQQDKINMDFNVLALLQSIVAEGKGIRKILIQLYMEDICDVANQLLLSTFDGQLYLRPFIITDSEFTIPYSFNGSESDDVSLASAAQRAMIASAINLAILSRRITTYGIYTGDELDGPLNPRNKSEFIQVLTTQMKQVGINQTFIISQTGDYYEPYDPGFILFPGAELTSKNYDTIIVN